jgi:hypothetical protein
MAMENSDCNNKEKVDAKNSNLEFSKKQNDIISDMLSDTFLSTTKKKEKDERADNYVYNLAKKFFENCNNKKLIPCNWYNVVQYKLDNNLINDSEFKEVVDTSPAGNCDKNSIATTKHISLEQLKKLKGSSDVLKSLDNPSKSATFSFEIIKDENQYILSIGED